jgi:hypothetical protein
MAAELAAASSGSVVSGGLTMVAFGLGTLPLLFAFGTASSLIPGRWKQRLTFVLAFVVIAMGLVFLNRTAMILDFPINARTVQAAVIGTHAPVASTSEPSYTTGSDGVVEVRLSVANARFAPADLQIPAGKPVRLIVDRPDANPCSQQLLLPRLGVRQDLADNGTTTIDIPATDTGTFTMTCGMGMMAGRLIVGTGGGGAREPVSPGVWLVIAMIAAVFALWLAIGIRPARRLAPQGGPPVQTASPARRATPGQRDSKSNRPPPRARKKGARR